MKEKNDTCSFTVIDNGCPNLAKAPKHVGKFNQTLIEQLLETLVYQGLIVYADPDCDARRIID